MSVTRGKVRTAGRPVVSYFVTHFLEDQPVRWWRYKKNMKVPIGAYSVPIGLSKCGLRITDDCILPTCSRINYTVGVHNFKWTSIWWARVTIDGTRRKFHASWCACLNNGLQERTRCRFISARHTSCVCVCVCVCACARHNMAKIAPWKLDILFCR